MKYGRTYKLVEVHPGPNDNGCSGCAFEKLRGSCPKHPGELGNHLLHLICATNKNGAIKNKTYIFVEEK